MPGQIAYEAYRNHTGGISLITKQSIPQWSELSPLIQTAWEAAAKPIVVESPLYKYINDPAVLLAIPQPHRFRISELLSEMSGVWFCDHCGDQLPDRGHICSECVEVIG